MKHLIAIISVLLLPWMVQAQPSLRTEQVILITFDGLRWQELFTGADLSLIGDEAFVAEHEVND